MLNLRGVGLIDVGFMGSTSVRLINSAWAHRVYIPIAVLSIWHRVHDKAESIILLGTVNTENALV
jgi:hypothetical protein